MVGMRVGVVDCGTNTVRLLIAEGPAGGPLTDVVRLLRYVRLGQGVDATRRFDPAALVRTFAALDKYAAAVAQYGPLDALRFLATSAVRDVTNRDEFFAGVEARLGVVPDVISGREEARLSFLGALAGGPLGAGHVLVMDIGGGSTELIYGDAEGEVLASRSYDMGSVRLRERFLVDDPPTSEQIAAAREFVSGQIDPAGSGSLDIVGQGVSVPGDSFVGVAGTCTSLSAMNMGLTSYDSSRVHNSVLTPGEIGGLAEHLLSSPINAVQAEYPTLEPLRAEVICAGALICEEVVKRLRMPMIVRETDILDGAALALVAQR